MAEGDWRQIAATSEGVSFTHFAKKVSFFLSSFDSAVELLFSLGLFERKIDKACAPFSSLHLLAQRTLN